MNFEVFEYLKKIEKRLENFEHWQKVSFAACCTEINFPLVESFGENITVQFYKIALNRIWECILSSSLNANNDVTQLLEDLDFLPESEEDDSHSKSFRTMVALGTMYHALNVVKLNSVKDTKLVSSTSQSNKSSIEFVISNAEGYSQNIKHDDPPIPMTVWDRKEIAFQEEIIGLLENQLTPNQELIKTLKA